MRIIAENFTAPQLIPILDELNVLVSGLGDNVEWVRDIKEAPHELYSSVADGILKKVILPTDKGIMFVYLYLEHKEDTEYFAGATIPDGHRGLSGDRCSIIIYSDDTSEVILLRIVHEYLHALQLPADDLAVNAWSFLHGWKMLKYLWYRLFNREPEHMPEFQRIYYKWLLDNSEMDMSEVD